jgi:predicted ATPase
MKSRKKTTDKKIPAITALSVTGYKSVYNTRKIRIAPLTLLAGANSSGKSSFIQPFLLLKQTLEAPYDPGVLLLDGENVKITDINQMLSNLGTGKKASEFSLGIELDDYFEFTFLYEKSKKTGLEIKAQEFIDKQDREKSFSLRPDMSRQEIEKNVPDSLKRLLLSFKNHQLRIMRERCFLSAYLSDSTGSTGKLSFGLFESYIRLIKKMIHLPGLRGNPERMYKTTAVGNVFPGRFENYVASIIYYWQINKDAGKLRELGTSLRTLGLTWTLQAKKKDDSRVEILVGRLTKAKKSGAKDLVSIADFGLGVSQILPVITALIVAEKSQTVYLEQPEIHLHPRAQAALAMLLAKAAKRGVRVIVETHSSLLLRGVQTLIAKGDLSPADVALHWFSRNKDDGETEIVSADLDENGAFGDWPEDFDDVMLDADRDYLDAVEKR